MSCCGRRRQAVVTRVPASGTPTSSPRWRTPAFSDAAARRDEVRVRYRGLGPFTARGARTGRLYACGVSGTVLSVAPADAEALLRTRRFVRE